MKLVHLSEASLTEFLSDSKEPAVLAFHAGWSKPARTMLPIVETVAKEYEGLARFGLVDADHTLKLLDHFGILSLPTFLVFKQGRQVDRFIGVLTKEKLIERIEASIQKT